MCEPHVKSINYDGCFEDRQRIQTIIVTIHDTLSVLVKNSTIPETTGDIDGYTWSMFF